MKKLLALTALSASLGSPISAMAGPLLTSSQTAAFSFSSTGNDSFTFDGFNSALGTLNSVHFEWGMDKTLVNTASNNTATVQTVGSPLALTATSSTIFTGSGLASQLTDTHSLTTAGYSGSIAAGTPFTIPGLGTVVFPTVTTVGTATETGLTGGVCLSNDSSCGSTFTNVSTFIGGASLFNISIDQSSTQGGSVPPGVFSGNTSTTTGTISLYYDYTATASNTVTEPTSVTLLGLGLSLTGFHVFARRKTR